MNERTFGWIQNASDFQNLKNTVAIFCRDSEINQSLRTDKLPRLIQDEFLRNRFINELEAETIVIPYADLKGKGPCGNKRKDALCTGIVQAAIPGQKAGKEYTDDWSAECFLRWAVTLGFLNYNHQSATCSLSESGKNFAEAENQNKENELIGDACLAYPPAVRILSLLAEKGPLTKFELGARLGFVGEAGFTSIPQNIYVAALQTTSKEELGKIRSNTEGSSDKYARMIASWLKKIHWVSTCGKEVSVNQGNRKYTEKLTAYELTLDGRKNLKRALGQSSVARVPKRVFYEMLATKSSDKNISRRRRALIIKYLESKSRTLAEIQDYLRKNEISASFACIWDDLEGLRNIGLNITYTTKKNREQFKLLDEITCLEIPDREPVETSDLAEVKERVREKLQHVNHKFLVLLDLARDGKANLEFEIQTLDLLTQELKFSGCHLGNGRRPDGIASYGENGVIIDTKSYSGGYSLPIDQADEMIRYIDENAKRNEQLNSTVWWKCFENTVKKFHFLFVSSEFVNTFKERLNYIFQRTDIYGGVINAENLLYLAEELKSGRMSYPESFSLFQNDEIQISHENTD